MFPKALYHTHNGEWCVAEMASLRPATRWVVQLLSTFFDYNMTTCFLNSWLHFFCSVPMLAIWVAENKAYMVAMMVRFRQRLLWLALSYCVPTTITFKQLWSGNAPHTGNGDISCKRVRFSLPAFFKYILQILI